MPRRRGEAARRRRALRFACAISETCARVARSSWAMRSLTADRSTEGAATRGADFTSLTPAASFSDCARNPERSPRNEATDFSSASTRLAMAGSGAGAAGLLILASMPATRAARSSITAALNGGAEDVAGKTAGHPKSQPTQITNAAATAPDTGAMTQGEIAAAGSSETGSSEMGLWEDGSWEDGSSETGSGGASSAAFRVSLDTSDASRSMVGGGRLARPESGDGVVSSGLSSTIAPVPYLLVPNITRFGASDQSSALISSEPRPDLLFWRVSFTRPGSHPGSSPRHASLENAL